MQRTSALFLVLLLSTGSHAQEEPAPLAPKYVQFLDVAEWILTPEEVAAFASLESDQRRDGFIERFWKARDPTRATLQNEFLDEHLKRIQYAEKFLGKGSRKRGSKTQRGRIHILLGKPLTIEREDGGKTWPIEMWFYQGLSMPGLPSSMYIVFFKPNEVGEWQLYSPVSDGPMSLVRGMSMKQNSNEIAVRLLNNTSLELARASLSMDASARPDLASFTPGIDRVGEGLQQLPSRQADLRYIQPFLEGREDVDTEFSFSYIPVRTSVWVTREEGRQFLAYALEIQPRDLSVAQHEDRVSARLELDGTITDTQSKLVASIEDRLEFGLNPREFQAVATRPLQIQGRRPVAPGTYTVTLIVRNVVSRQYGRYEGKIVVPEANAWGSTLLAYRITGAPDKPFVDERPFDTSWARPAPWSGNEISSGAPVIVVVQAPSGAKQAKIRLEGPGAPQEWTAAVRDGLLVHTLPRESLSVGTYNLTVNENAAGKLTFEVLPGFWAEPWVASGTMASANSTETLLSEAEFLERTGRRDQALKQLRKHFEGIPAPDPALRFGLASLNLRAGQFAEVEKLVGPTVAEMRYRTAQKGQGTELWFRLLAFAEAGAGNPAQAAVTLGEALERTVPTPEMLNQQARWYRDAQKPDLARQAYTKSLQLEPAQPQIRKEMEALR